MSIFQRVKQTIKTNKATAESGGFNAIPWNLPRLSKILPGIQRAKLVGVTASSKVGKCFGKGTKVILSNGIVKPVEEIVDGDILLGPDSTDRVVSGVTSGTEGLYKITQHNGNSFVVNKSHILYLREYTPMNFSSYKGEITSRRATKYRYMTMTVGEYLELSPNIQNRYRMVQANEVVYNINTHVAIDPYFYGLWLGDGDMAGCSITNIDKEIIDYLHEFAELHDCTIKENNYIRYRIKQKTTIEALNLETGEKKYYNTFREIAGSDNKAAVLGRKSSRGVPIEGILYTRLYTKNKFYNTFVETSMNQKVRINSNFLYSSVENRYKLLAGMIDSDGSKSKNSIGYEITFKQKSLIEDLCFLARSLGLTAQYKVRIIKGTPYYRAFVSGHNCHKIPVLLERKKSTVSTSPIDYRHRSFSIEYVGIGEYYGFAVDKDNLFLLDDFTIVHNSQLTDYLFLHQPYEFLINNPASNLKPRIFYFSLEMSKETKIMSVISYKLFKEHNISKSPEELLSVFKGDIVDDDIMKLIEGYDKFFEEFEKRVTFIDNIRNPYGIFKYMETYANENGHWEYKEIDWEEEDGSFTKRKVKDYYIPNDAEELVIVITDHISLLSPEKGQTLHQAMGKFSSDYCLYMRDKLKYCIVLVQQQAAEQEKQQFTLKGDSVIDKLRPSADGTGDNKLISRDLNLLLGLFAPYRYKFPDYAGYDLNILQDNYRELSVILNRDGKSNAAVDLYFDGASNFFTELPKPTEKEELLKVYEYCKSK